jgi:stage V sporulation protein R
MNMLPQGSEWTDEHIVLYYEAIEKIAAEYGLDTYPNQLDVITWEQMIDAYTSIGLPMMYNHWSFGMEFVTTERSYSKGQSGLAYELVINSNPCISYLMETNTLALQALVIAHAAFGHNSFFKGNYLFKEWTDADGIMDYLEFAKSYIAKCEERHGVEAVMRILDSAHALKPHGVDRYKKPQKLSPKGELSRLKDHVKFIDDHYDAILAKTVHEKEVKKADPKDLDTPELVDEENLLYFLEKRSPNLESWEREILRIVRKIAQYFYPQGQTKVMNEGWATFWHYTILQTMADRGQIGPGMMIDIIRNHTNVVMQPPFDVPWYSGINPYALGFRMFQEIRRMCENPTAEDTEFFPDIVGTDWKVTLDHVMRNYRDESFVLQYLTPNLVREFQLFALETSDEHDDHYLVKEISDPNGFKRIRAALARQYEYGTIQPNIEVCELDPRDLTLTLVHKMHDGWPLSESAPEVVKHFARLWGRPVRLVSEYTDAGVVVRDELCFIEPTSR